MTAKNNVAAQAGDETAALAKQLATWRAEVARLNDLIAHASGVQAGGEPMRAQLREDLQVAVQLTGKHYADSYVDYYPAMKRIFAFVQVQLAQVSPRATADVERDAARYQALTTITDWWSNPCLLPVIDWMRDWETPIEDINEALD